MPFSNSGAGDPIRVVTDGGPAALLPPAAEDDEPEATRTRAQIMADWDALFADLTAPYQVERRLALIEEAADLHLDPVPRDMWYWLVGFAKAIYGLSEAGR